MRIAVIYKWARDPAHASVLSDGSIDWRGAKMTAGEDDPAVLEAALSIASGNSAEVVGLTIGDGDASWVLARKVESTTSITDVPVNCDQSATGSVLAQAVQRSGANVAVIGDSTEYPGVPLAMAAELGWPVIAQLSSARSLGDRILCVRRKVSGEEEIEISAPVVLAFSAEAEEKSAPGMKETLAARKKTMEKLTLAEAGIEVKERVKVEAHQLPEAKVSTIFEGENAVSQLIDALRKEGVLA